MSGCCTVWQGQPSSAGMKYAQPQFLDKVLHYGSTAVNIISLIYLLVWVSFWFVANSEEFQWLVSGLPALNRAPSKFCRIQSQANFLHFEQSLFSISILNIIQVSPTWIKSKFWSTENYDKYRYDQKHLVHKKDKDLGTHCARQQRLSTTGGEEKPFLDCQCLRWANEALYKHGCLLKITSLLAS